MRLLLQNGSTFSLNLYIQELNSTHSTKCLVWYVEIKQSQLHECTELVSYACY